LRRLIVLLAGVWVGWWAAREIAARLANGRPAGPSPLESEHPPGWMRLPK
jgi:hypothetical protein